MCVWGGSGGGLIGHPATRPEKFLTESLELDEVANQIHVQNVHYVHKKREREAQKFSIWNISAYHVFLPKSLSDFYDTTVNQQFP